MKVILLKDVAKIGRRFDAVDVPDGFALNKLIPQGLAQSATPENMKRLQNLSAKVSHDREVSESSFKEALAACKDVEIRVEVEANSEGRMFQALKADAIVSAIKQATGHEFGSEHLIIKTPIKSVGEYQVDAVSGDVHGVITLQIEAKGK